MSPPERHPNKRPLTILVVEDTPADVDVLRDVLARDKQASYALRHAERLSAAKQFLEAGDIDIVLLDMILPDSQGLPSLVTLRGIAPQVPIIVLTATDDEELALQALQKGAQDYILKGHLQIYRHLLGRTLRYAVERKRAEEELHQAYAQTEQLLASLTSILIGIGPDGAITYWNDVAAEVFERPAEAVVGRPLALCGVQMELATVQQGLSVCRASGRPLQLEDMRFTTASRREGFVGFTVIPIRGRQGRLATLLFGAEVTKQREAEAERARLQEQLAQAHKMEVIGRFAGGIAHDFHNFLAVMRGFTELIADHCKDDADVTENVAEILRAADSALALVNQILAFSRRQVLNPKVVDLNQSVRAMARFLQQLLGEFVHLEFHLAEEALWVKTDPTGLEQIVMNLSTNARDAMQRKGTLTIRTRRISVDPAFRAARPWAAHPSYVQLTIRDTGQGMEPAVAARIFEPFFTTKQLGRGTGLGLAVVYGLVQQHGGSVEVETAVGQGTAFHVFLPCDVEPSRSRTGREADNR
jgi:signal transduction histidine kinase/FixJ family two-component response regulator